ncbi:MAG: hypothetical protein A2V96_01050 [Candidatus Yonathbacteria bacterium RBG_16_43_6]|uniref:Uncharacterized protein n=2 Tax=Parcubacteria group TaxID=1794811 RepID=A0A1G2SD72_9BACT|nr:MAG: hypothetical protein A2V96_01050 [Candidatus Yonathbacteria bacterium RBG_16_43_6]OHA78858.1 MAG: hypothetical protein A2658_00515 [Candidatus Yonathbacteria bacterium RIFCSPHIGHO2_01_FULL_44_19]OHA82935.1 MAG: hypothetical protein A3B07_03560 [Candidatus Yonathbacteria bacterium RIFCSPLOWO2_01_FULL_43_27]
MNKQKFINIVAKVTVLSIIGNVILAILGRIASSTPDTFGPYMYGPVIGLTVAGVFAAAVVYYVMRLKYADAVKANKHFLIISWAVLVLSMVPDILIPWIPEADMVGWTYVVIANLMLMHVVAGGLVMYYFTRKELLPSQV